MKTFQTKRVLNFRAALLAAFLCAAAAGIFHARLAPFSLAAQAQRTNRPRSPRRAPVRTSAPRVTQFPHAKHSAKCDSCHQFPSSNWKTVRKTEAFPDITEYPRHESCLSCHRQQFFRGAKPSICSVCHTNPSPNDSSRHPFPNPREVFDRSPKGKTAVSDFQISFPHDKHIEIVSQNEAVNAALFVNARFRRADASTSCAVCHQTHQPQGDSADEYFTKPPEKLGDGFWLKKGTFKTAPTGHATCFTCHSADTGILPAPTGCATCHKPSAPFGKSDFDAKIAATMKIDDKITLEAWRRRDSSAKFRHEFSSHADMDCASCHNVAAMQTTDWLSKKVTITSCNMCHITETPDEGGILNYEIDERKKNAKFECAKCHLAYGRSPIPESHLKAVGALTAK